MRADDLRGEVVRAEQPHAAAIVAEVFSGAGVASAADVAQPRLLSSTKAVSSSEIQRWNAAVNRGLVSAYKLIGFVLLAVILIGIISFVGLHSFYLVHRAWVVPRVVSPSDAQVIDLRTRLAQETQRREALVRQRLEDEVQLKQLQLTVAAERAFQQALPGAMALDATARRESAAALQQAQAAQQHAGQALLRLGQQVQYSSMEQLKRDFAAKLIDRQQFLQQSYQLGQVAQAGPRWMEQQAQLRAQIQQLSHEAAAYEAVGGGPPDAKIEFQVG